MPCCGWLKRLTICSCCFCQNELFLVLQEICVQRTLINRILLILCFCTALFFILMSLLQMHYIFLPFMVHKTKMSLTIFHCHTILTENVCRLLCNSMLPTMFMCKVKAHSSGIICRSRKNSFKGKCSLMINIHHE